jgi:putative colanic acid biosynthesis UDP-glucose lipid carrier transferase
MPGPQAPTDVTTQDPDRVFLVKALLYPVLTVSFLALCLLLGERPVTRIDVLTGVLAFAGVAEFIEVPALGLYPGSRKLLQLFGITVRWAMVASALGVLLYLLDFSAALLDPAMLAWLVMMPVLLWSGSLFASAVMHLDVGRGPMRNAVIVGATQTGTLVGSMLESQPLLGIRSLGMFSTADDDGSVRESRGLLGTIDDVVAYVASHDVRLVYITVPLSSAPRMDGLLKALQNTTATVYFVPCYLPRGQRQARIDVVHGIPMIAVSSTPMLGLDGMVKRLSDLVLSSLALLVLSPLLACIAIAIKLSSPGPAFFKQRRYGLDGQDIMVYKFRSMSVTEDGAAAYTQVTRNDSRVTPLGALLRRTSCDELPQLLNVFEGSMSLVGPRPHAVAVNEHYRGLIDSYMSRHRIKPGITGWAQVNGYRGGDDLPSMTKRIECDLYYVANWSLALDARIVARTVSLLWRDSHAY